MSLSVVPLARPEMAEAAEFLRDMALRYEGGEFDALILLSFRPDGTFLTTEKGKRHNRLEMIGLLETIKADLLDTMSSDLEG